MVIDNLFTASGGNLGGGEGGATHLRKINEFSEIKQSLNEGGGGVGNLKVFVGKLGVFAPLPPGKNKFPPLFTA